MVLLAMSATALNVLKILHIITAVYFGAGVVLATIFSLQIPNTPTLTAKAKIMRRNSRVALSMIVPGALVTAIFGFIVAWQEYARPFDHRWILYSTILFVLAFLLGGASGPMNARVRRLVETEARSGKKPSAELYKALRSPVALILTLVNVAIFVALLYLMFAKMPA